MFRGSLTGVSRELDGCFKFFLRPLPAGQWSSQSQNLDCLIDLLTFSYRPTRATRDIIIEGNELEELEEVKTLWKAILELC